MKTAELETELRALPVSEKARLADLLLSSIDTEESEEIEQAWAFECKRRMDAFDQGEIQAFDGEKVINDLEKRYNG